MEESNMKLDSLTTKSAKSIISSLPEDVKIILLRELLKEDPLETYRRLGDSIYGGVRLGGRYTYGIFSVCNIDEFTNYEFIHIHKLYKYLDELGRGEDFQIMFINHGGYLNTKFDCARPFSEKRSLIEHPEARLLYEVLKDKPKKESEFAMHDWCIAVRFRDGLYREDGSHVLIGEKRENDDEISTGYGDNVYVKLFSEAIESSGHCDEFQAWCEFEDLEFTITVKGEKCQVLYRRFECEGNDGG